jgi:hypothetical protein
MTSESTESLPETFDPDTHDQDIKKSYYHIFDDESIQRMKKYFKVENDASALVKYLKARKVPGTALNDV